MCSFECGWHLRARDFNAAGAARVMFGSILRHLVTDDSDIQAAELVFGELVANALQYSDKDVRVEVFHAEGDFRLAVCDRGLGFDPDALDWPTASQERGRGLLIVNALSGHVHVTRVDGGCRVSTQMVLRCRAWAA